MGLFFWLIRVKRLLFFSISKHLADVLITQNLMTVILPVGSAPAAMGPFDRHANAPTRQRFFTSLWCRQTATKYTYTYIHSICPYVHILYMYRRIYVDLRHWVGESVLIAKRRLHESEFFQQKSFMMFKVTMRLRTGGPCSLWGAPAALIVVFLRRFKQKSRRGRKKKTSPLIILFRHLAETPRGWRLAAAAAAAAWCN